MLEPCHGGIDILDKLETKLSLLTAIDASIVIEVAACRALVHKSGLKLMQDAILKALPTIDLHFTLDMALHELKKLASSELYVIVNSDGKGLVDATISILSKMQSGTGPTKSLLANTDFMQQVLDGGLTCQKRVPLLKLLSFNVSGLESISSTQTRRMQ